MTNPEALHHYATKKDAEAFRLLVHNYQRLVYSAAARRLAHSHDIEDTVQLTFLKLARAAHTIRRDLSAWLYTTALHTANDLIRADHSRRRHETRAALTPPIAPSTEQADREELHQLTLLLDEALLQLPPGQQSLIIEHFFQSRSQRDLAAELNTTQATISRRLAAAIESLRTHLRTRAPAARLASSLSAVAQSPVTIPSPLTTQLTKIGLVGTTGASKSALFLTSTTFATKLALTAAAAILIVIPTLIITRPKSPSAPSIAAAAPAVAPATRPAAAAPATQPATISKGDDLAISIFELTSPGQEYTARTTVDPQGEITLLNLNKVKAEGLSPAQLEALIGQTAVEQGYLLPKSNTHAGPRVSVKFYAPPPIAKGNTLAITVDELITPHQEYNIRATVDPQGNIALLKLNTLKAEGLTPAQLELLIAKTAVDKGLLLPKTDTTTGPRVSVNFLNDAIRANPLRAATVFDIPADNTPILSVQVSGLTPDEFTTTLPQLKLRPGQPFTNANLRADTTTLGALGNVGSLSVSFPSTPGPDGFPALNLRLSLRHATNAPPPESRPVPPLSTTAPAPANLP